MASTKERQAAYRSRAYKKGQVATTIYLPDHQAVADIRTVAKFLCDHPHLELGPLRDPVSGKWVRWR